MGLMIRAILYPCMLATNIESRDLTIADHVQWCLILGWVFRQDNALASCHNTI